MITNAKLIGSVDPAVYHGQLLGTKRGDCDFVMSRTELCVFDECPAKWLKGWSKKDSSGTEWGTLMDALVLDGERFNDKFAVCPEFYPAEVKGVEVMKPWNWNANYCKEWREQQGGKSVIKPEEHKEAMFAHSVLFEHDQVSAILSDSNKQVMAIAEWKEGDSIVPLKVLIDIVPQEIPGFRECLCDFKTAACADPKRWPFICDSYGYDVQAALYLDVYNVATKEQRTDWLHVVQENEPPYHVELVFLDNEFIELGRAKYRAALQHYAECLSSEKWGGYSMPPHTLRSQGIPFVKHTAKMEMSLLDRMPPLVEPPAPAPNQDDVPTP